MATYYHDTPEGRIPFTPEQEAQRDAEIAAWEAGESDRKASAIREERNRLLTESDWRALTDQTLTDEWRDYRQALRDISSQEGFPDSVVWPTVPAS